MRPSDYEIAARVETRIKPIASGGVECKTIAELNLEISSPHRLVDAPTLERFHREIRRELLLKLYGELFADIQPHLHSLRRNCAINGDAMNAINGINKAFGFTPDEVAYIMHKYPRL